MSETTETAATPAAAAAPTPVANAAYPKAIVDAQANALSLARATCQDFKDQVAGELKSNPDCQTQLHPHMIHGAVRRAVQTVNASVLIAAISDEITKVLLAENNLKDDTEPAGEGQEAASE